MRVLVPLLLLAIALFALSTPGSSVKLKQSVDPGCITGAMVLAAQVVEGVFESHGYELVITSVCDGHRTGSSLHPSGFAIDFRTRHVPNAKRPALAEAVSEALGDAFDVVLESDHLHVEFDP